MEKSLNGHDRALQAITKNAQKKGELESKGKKVKDKVEKKIRGPKGKGPKAPIEENIEDQVLF